MLRSASPRSLQAAQRDLGSERSDVRESAARDITRHADDHRDEVVTALIAALGDEHAEVRAAVITSLADIGAKEATARIVEASDDAHAFVRQMALSALGEIGDERALPVFSAALDSDTPSDRFQAVMGIARTSHDAARVRQVLLQATRDEDELVRHIALRVAEEQAGDDVVDPLIMERAKALLDDDSNIVRVAAAIILARGGRRDGADILSAVASREVITSEHDDEAAAIELCGELRLTAAQPALLKRAFSRIILLSRDPFAWHARVALAAMREPRAVRWVLEELGAWTKERRTLAVAAAGRARLEEARELITAMVGDEERADAHAVEEALGFLDAARDPA